MTAEEVVGLYIGSYYKDQNRSHSKDQIEDSCWDQDGIYSMNYVGELLRDQVECYFTDQVKESL